MSSRADVVIIGAGIVGLTIAYELARGGVARVIVFDAGSPGQQSTGRSTGGIRQQFGSELEIRMTQAALKFYEPVFSSTDFDGRFERDGYLFLAGKAQEGRLLAAWRVQQQMGVPSEWLDQETLRDRYPYIESSDLAGATWCAEDGFVDPWSIVQWLLRECRSRGVEIRSQQRVDAIDVAQQRVRSVTAGAERFEAPIVVNAAGAWAGAVGELAGVPTPVRPSPRIQLVTDLQQALPTTTPLVVDLMHGGYVRSIQRRVLAGASPRTIPIGFELEPRFEEVDGIATCVSRRFPDLRDVGISRVISGLYEVTPDGLPIASFSEHVAGFAIVAGFNGHGIMHSPPLACAMADIILHGRAERFDVEPFSARRFSAGQAARRRASSLL
jgi:glycine/D-amino acid oxidase-like deaminating enzyme